MENGTHTHTHTRPVRVNLLWMSFKALAKIIRYFIQSEIVVTIYDVFYQRNQLQALIAMRLAWQIISIYASKFM